MWLCVVITRLNKVDSRIAYNIGQPMFLGNPTRPDSRTEILQWFWFADPIEGITLYDYLHPGGLPILRLQLNQCFFDISIKVSRPLCRRR